MTNGQKRGLVIMDDDVSYSDGWNITVKSINKINMEY